MMRAISGVVSAAAGLYANMPVALSEHLRNIGNPFPFLALRKTPKFRNVLICFEGRATLSGRCFHLLSSGRRYERRIAHYPGETCINLFDFPYCHTPRVPACNCADAVAELVELQDEYRAWLDALPPSLADSATADALRAICYLDLSEFQGIEPPRGFGRD